MGQPNVFTRVLSALSTTVIATTQSPGTGTITLANVTSGVTLDTQRRVAVYSGGNDTAITFTIFGTNQSGAKIQETITGGNTTSTPAVSNLDFYTVTNIVHTGTVTSTLSVGTGNTGSSMWQIVNWNPNPTNIGWVIEARSGTAAFNLEYTLDDPNILPGTGGLNAAGLVYSLPITITSATLVATGTATLATNFTSPIVAWRLTTTSGTGTLVLRALQSGLGTP